MIDEKKQYLLDTNVLVRRPGLLARSDAAKRFLIPIGAIDQLSNRGNGTNSGPLQRVLSTAANSGVVIVDAPKILHPSPPISPDFRLDAYDLSILSTLIELQSDSSRKICLVTDDRALLKAATQIGIEAIPLAGLQDILDREQVNTESAINLEVDEQVQQYERSERSNIQRAIVIGLFAIGIAAGISYFYPQIFDLLASTPRLLIGVGALLFGALLYWFRQRHRSSYGMVETVLGAWISANAFPLNSAINITSVLQIMGGLYVVVRGLDNLGNGLKGTRYEPNWRRIFRLA
jgi:hypothetical protein